MLKKFTNKKGFTLMEMLIVVAIIAILIAIAIPTFTGAMNKANAATDLANIRSGYAAAQLEAMTDKAPAADVTYYLKKDGTVKEGSDAQDYICKGSSDNADGATEVGGKYNVTWAPKDKITYTVKKGSNTVDSIQKGT